MHDAATAGATADVHFVGKAYCNVTRHYLTPPARTSLGMARVLAGEAFPSLD